MKKENYKVFQFYIPYSMDFWEIVNMFKFNGIKVDDMCSSTRDGRVVNLWINENDLDNYNIDQKVGYFLSEGK